MNTHALMSCYKPSSSISTGSCIAGLVSGFGSNSPGQSILGFLISVSPPFAVLYPCKVIFLHTYIRIDRLHAIWDYIKVISVVCWFPNLPAVGCQHLSKTICHSMCFLQYAQKKNSQFSHSPLAPSTFD